MRIGKTTPPPPPRPKNDWNDRMNKTKQSLWSFDNEIFVNCLPGAAWKPAAN